MRRMLMIGCMAMLLAGCGQPLPPDKADYAGSWQGGGVVLQIAMDGRVEYQRVEGSHTRSVSGPIKEFQGDSFSVGIGPLSTVFEVSSKPSQRQGEWRMTVDGVQLRRVP